MSEHVCWFVFDGAHCTRPVAHSLLIATIVDGKYVERKEHWMCEECFNAWAVYAREAGWKLD